MKTLSEITSDLRELKGELSQKYPIKSIAIFGSYARSQQDQNSDLDLMVEFDDKVGLKFIKLADEIEGFLGLKVDLVSKKGIKPKYFKEIESELIYV